MKSVKEFILLGFVVVCFSLVAMTVRGALQEAHVNNGDGNSGYQVNVEVTAGPGSTATAEPAGEPDTIAPTGTLPSSFLTPSVE